MEEKSKVEQFEEKLEELIREEKVYFDLSYEKNEAAKELIEKLEPDPEERKEMEELLYYYEIGTQNALEEMLIDELTEKVGRYGGDTQIISDCVQHYCLNFDTEAAMLDAYADFIQFPSDFEYVYWGNFFKLFPNAKVPEGMKIYDYLVEQYELRNARDSAFDAIDWFLWYVGHRIIELRYGFPATGNQAHAIYRANDFRSFYPEFVEAFNEAATATIESAADIRKRYVKLQSKTKSTARRLLKVTPELVIPEEVKGKIGG